MEKNLFQKGRKRRNGKSREQKQGEEEKKIYIINKKGMKRAKWSKKIDKYSITLKKIK